MNRRKFSVIAFIALFISFLGAPLITQADAKTPDGELRVGMEAGYAPFNWTQKDDRNGAVQIQGDKAYAGGYDVQMAKKIADKMNRKLVIVKTEWDGLLPALQSGKIDAIIAGMSPTAERRKEVDFSDPYYESQLVIVTRKDSKYAKASSIKDFSGAKITAQLSTFHYSVIDQIPDVKKQEAMDNFPAMRVALESGTIDGYVSERPEGVTAASVNPDIMMVEFDEADGFQTNPEDVQVSVGMRKGDPDMAQINQTLAGISQDERVKIMDQAIKDQPAADETESTTTGKKENVFVRILKQNGSMFLRGTGVTLLLAIVGTTVGTLIGLLVGVFRTLPEASNGVKRGCQKAFGWLLNAYIEIFRGTPMIVQSAVIYYGIAMAFGIDLNRTAAALFIVSINTGAYMSEIVRGGIFAVDPGQFEAAHAIGMTHGQTMRKVVLPQVLRNILPATGNELVINIKDTSVLSIISVSELFFQGKSAAGTNYLFFQTYFIICVIYFVLTFTATRILRVVEKKMDGPSAYVRLDDVDVAVAEDK
ncbi:ABC transporter permease subunit [Enterococcus pseudoavium]|uniref:ABC transporter permease subunit n=1 Tax=Enterococcus pseudoavium TaxID=44007 RepID=A0AAE4HY04_9ENTE|nr:ABC transporter permease subunit [Enterococcus pseudoavium]MDT2736075.1 ABC transporter permease subunit [Enterococcus pseudoavium]MDT2770080.1 ABC transporter permease subunit [Enterococcus pseudoavium]REC32814.1 amino acid ABC transporter permease [Enterococcus pseudoavium]